MEMYDNEFETKQNKNLNSWIKLNHNIVKVLQSGESSFALRNALNQWILIKSFECIINDRLFSEHFLQKFKGLWYHELYRSLRNIITSS